MVIDDPPIRQRVAQCTRAVNSERVAHLLADLPTGCAVVFREVSFFPETPLLLSLRAYVLRRSAGAHIWFA